MHPKGSKSSKLLIFVIFEMSENPPNLRKMLQNMVDDTFIKSQLLRVMRLLVYIGDTTVDSL